MKKEPIKDRYYSFLFFIFIALIIVFGIVAVMQIRVAQVTAKTASIEDSVTRIEGSMQKVMEAIRKYDWEHMEASDFSQRTDRGVEVGIGDRREETK